MKAAISRLAPVVLLLAIFISCTQKDYNNTTITNPPFLQPEISITLPVPGDTLRGLVAISVQASGNAEISHVQFYLDGVLPDSAADDSSAPYQYLWNTVNATDGNHQLWARAWTPQGNYGDAVPLLVLTDNINENAPRNLRVPSQYPTIQQGVNAAKDGDTVLVEPGIYYETIIFLGKKIWVKSEFGPQLTILDGLYRNKLVYFMSGEDTTSVLCGFMMRSSYNGILMESDCSPTILNCIIKNMEYSGIIGAPIAANIINNTIYNCQDGVQIGGISYLFNNLVTNISSAGLWNASNNQQYSPIGDYNDVWNCTNLYANWNIGLHDISLNPIFIDTVNFRLAPNSPCRHAGNPNIHNYDGTTSDIGAWGGPNAYQQ
jgi:hypothetical protein